MSDTVPAEITPHDELSARFRPLQVQAAADGIPTFWFCQGDVQPLLRYLKEEIDRPYRLLYDLTCIDERERRRRASQPESLFTVVYQLFSYERNAFVRIKVPFTELYPAVPSVTGIWPSANWYEREAWDMFGVKFSGHPNLRRILLPPWWEGHPLRKEHVARATEMGPYEMTDDRYREEQQQLKFKPEEWGLKRSEDGREYMFLNLGPQHPGTHGPFRLILQLDGEHVVNVVPDIGYHHRGQEKIGERQSWHTYLPYTDRIDYLGGFLNELPYVLAVEKLAGIDVPERAQVIRVMLCELFRIISHLVYFGTFAQDLGAMSPVFYAFNDRERAFGIIEAITGARMHPVWFRIGGVAADLPRGWEQLLRDFLAYLPKRLNDYDKMVMRNSIFRRRTIGIGAYSIEEAIEWGATGPSLRACGMEWDFRKQQPYSGYEKFEFDVPAGIRGDCYDRAMVHLEEMRQSLRIIAQCVDNMPAGPCKSSHPLATPPLKEFTMRDIETLIDHFLGVSWGPVIPDGEAMVPTEGAKGNYSFYLISDGNTASYRTRIRTASFPHLQMLPLMTRNTLVADVLAILGSIDFVLGDCDR